MGLFDKLTSYFNPPTNDMRVVIDPKPYNSYNHICNRGNNCPWSDGGSSYCRKCGLRAEGSSQ